MKPVLKNSIACFYPQGFLDGINVPSIIDMSDKDYTIKQKPDAVFISLKKVVFFNKNGLSMLADILVKIKEEASSMIGFCDYDDKKYFALRDMFKNDLTFSLFESYEILSIFVAKEFDVKTKKIILYSDEIEQKNQLALELFEKGYSPVIAKTKEEFNGKKENFDFSISRSRLGNFDKKIIAHIKDNIIVYTLPEYIDSDIAKNFDSTYHQNSLKVGFRGFVFDGSNVSSMNIHGANFFQKLSTAGAEYGATICIAGLNSSKIGVAFKEDLEDSGVIFYNSLLEVFEDKFLKESLSGSGHISKQKPLSKMLIENAPVFIESAIHTIEVMTTLSGIKEKVRIGHFDLDLKFDFFAGSIGFYGHLEGIMLLVFPKEIAKKSCSILLEDTQSDDVEILDAIGEFVNIISGKAKTLLNKKGIQISNTLPRTFSSEDDVKDNFQHKKGVIVEFKFENEPFYFYLTA